MIRRILPLLILLPLVVPAAVVGQDAVSEDRGRDALADRDYARGVAIFDALVAKKPADPRADYRAMMAVRGLSLMGDAEATADAGEAFLARYPDSRFREKVAWTTARALLLAGRGEDASALMDAALDRLAGPAVRSRIAAYYLKAADRAFEGVPPKNPFDKGVPPDYARAQKLYGLARDAGLPEARKGAILLRFAKAAVMTKGYEAAAAAIEEVPDAKENPEALFLLGRARLGMGKEFRDAAREAFERLVSVAPRSPRAPEALLALDDPEHLERLVREYPESELAPKAAFREGQLRAKEGAVDLAVGAYLRAAERFPDSEYAPRAAFAAAETLGAAERYEEARTRYDEFLRRFPESPNWARARDRMTDAWYWQGRALFAKEGTREKGAKVWEALRNAYPLSPHAPATLLEQAEHPADPRAELALLREILARYPKSSEAPQAALRAATLLGREKIADEVAALEKLVASFPKTKQAQEAAQRLAVMQRESLTVSLPAPLPSTAPPALRLETRNLRELTGRVYRIDPVAYFGKHASFADLGDVMVEVIKPDATFRHQVLDYEDYRGIEGSLAVPVEGPGAYLVVVEGGKLRAMGLLLVSDVTLIAKEWPGGALAFVQDAATGEPVEGATVLAKAPSGKTVEAETGADGTVRIDTGTKTGAVGFLARRGDSVAFCGFGAVRRQARGFATRFHLSTDRPVYRPGQEVRYRAVVRRAAGDFFSTPAGEKLSVTVKDAEGNVLCDEAEVLSEFGTAFGAFALPADLPPGDYALVARLPSGETGKETVHVEAYRKPQIFLTAEPGHPTAVRGEKVEIALRARYAFGRPVADLPVLVSVRGAAENLSETVRTGPDGRATIVVDDARKTVIVRAEATDATGRTYYAKAMVPVTEAAYGATLTPIRDRLFPGEEARIKVLTADALGNPVAAEGTVEVARYPAFAEPAKLAAKTGDDGRAVVTFEPKEAGKYRLLYRGTDRAGHEVTAAADLVVIGKEERKVVVRAERTEVGVGEELRASVRTPAAGLWALVTLEGEEVYDHRVVKLASTEEEIAEPVEARHVPGVWIRVALAHDGELMAGEDRVEVRERLHLTVTPGREKYGPGELCRLDVAAADSAGKPVSAEVAVAVVDEGIYLIRKDDTPDLTGAFRPPARGDFVRTDSSHGFSYEGNTGALSEDLVAERERRRKSKSKGEILLEEPALKDAKVEDHNETDDDEAFGIGGGAGGAFGGRGGRRALKAMGGGATTEGLFAPRSEFRDTAFFRADVVTGEGGKATVEFRLPDDLTEWRVTARAASHGNAMGEARASLVTSRPLVLRTGLPRFLRAGDAVTAVASVVNGTGAAIDTEVALSPGAGPVALHVGKDGEEVVPWPLSGEAAGELALEARVTVAGGLGEDAEARKLRVLPYGVPWRTGFAGVTTTPGARALDLPADAVPGTARLTVRVAPSLLRAAFAGIEELRGFPYGCTEQTVNRFWPALEAAGAIRDLGLDASASLPGLDAAARAGALRLTYLQNEEGLWGWFRGVTNAEMTAYALVALGRAKAAGIEFSPECLAKAEKALPKLLSRTTEPDLRAFLLLGRSWSMKTEYPDLAPAFADRRRLSLRGLSHLALAYEPLGVTTQGETLRAEIAARAAAGVPDTETLAWVVAALAGAGDDAQTRRLVTELARRREGGGFGTTRRTGAAVIALARAAVAFGAAAPTDRVLVSVNGAKVEERAIGEGGAIRLDPALLRPGRNEVAVTSSGGAAVLYTVTLECVREKAPESAPPLTLARKLSLVPAGGWKPADRRREKILRGDGERNAPEVQRVRPGDTVRVRLLLRNMSRERYLVVEDPIPAGFEVVPGSAKGPYASAVRHDDRMVFFLEHVGLEVPLEYWLRAEGTAEVRIPPATAYAMYAPSLASWSPEGRLSVREAEARSDADPTAGLSADTMWHAIPYLAEDPKTQALYLDALLDRFDLVPVVRRAALRTLAAARAALGEPERAVDALTALLAEAPDVTLTVTEERWLADGYRKLGRHGEAVGAMERAAALLFRRDSRVERELPEGAEGLTDELLDRYPFSSYGEAGRVAQAERAATAFEAALARGEKPGEAGLAPLREFLARYPESARAPAIAFRLARAWLRAGAWEKLEAEVRRFSDRWPDHALTDDADWFLAYALFAEKRYEAAEQVALASLAKEYPTEDGRTAYARNLTHLLAQTAQIAGRLGEAVRLYEQVKDATPDAREALRILTEFRLTVPEVTRVLPGGEVTLPVKVKNATDVSWSLYPIDLLVYFTLKKDVDRVAALNLDGLTPTKIGGWHEDGPRDYREHERSLDLGALGPGVYLAFVRAGEVERRALVLVSGITARIWGHEDGVRVLVTDRRTGAPVPDAFVKVARNGDLLGEGRTDPRGVFEIRGRRPTGRLTAVAEKAGACALTSE